MTRLVVDIGGTSIRLAYCRDHSPELFNISQFACADYTRVDDVLLEYCARHKLDSDEFVLAVAGPVNGPLVDITNNHWEFDAGLLASVLGVNRYLLINDFTAQALAYRGLFQARQMPANSKLKMLRSGTADYSTPLLVIGPGTGLGVAALAPVGDDVKIIEGEGGHVSYAPRNSAETNVLGTLQDRFGHVSAERIVSGPGLATMFEIQTGQFKPAPEIGALALAGDADALAAVHLMLQSLATVAANAAITLGARAGIVIAGGIVPKLEPLFAASGFFDRFDDHGRRRSYLQPIPVYVSTDPFAALYGASDAFDSQYLQSQICYLT